MQRHVQNTRCGTTAYTEQRLGYNKLPPSLSILYPWTLDVRVKSLDHSVAASGCSGLTIPIENKDCSACLPLLDMRSIHSKVLLPYLRHAPLACTPAIHTLQSMQLNIVQFFDAAPAVLQNPATGTPHHTTCRLDKGPAWVCGCCRHHLVSLI